jgi:Ca-activated chloride channel homolog
MRFLSENMLWWFWVIPVLLAMMLYGRRRKLLLIARFASGKAKERVSQITSRPRGMAKAILLVSGFALLVIGLARPAWRLDSEEIERKGRDVVFVLDVSRSMLAEDLRPNRLERAKLAIRDCLEVLRGDRVALVVFAGSSLVKVPLTFDYSFFRMMLDDVTVDSVPRGGTMIGDAIRKSLNEVFDAQHREIRDLILITDGEDQGSFPIEAAGQAGEEGIRLIAIGLGNEKQGARIPIVDERGQRRFMTHKGEEVWSRLDADTLRSMAALTPGGVYLNVATGSFDLGEIYTNLVRGAAEQRVSTEVVNRYKEGFQVFLGMVLLLLVLEALLSEKRSEGKDEV